ncbi:MAG: hypothetical protein NVS9B15_07040 [Acidobacteriaceae bacterium]
MSSRPTGLLSRMLLTCLALSLGAVTLSAQDANSTTPPPQAPTPKPAAASYSSDEVTPMHFELFGGYSWFAPNGRVGTQPLDHSINPGFAVSGAYFVNKYFGGDVQYTYHKGSRETISGITAGPVVRFPIIGLSPFIHFNVGAQRLSPSFVKASWGPEILAGGGLDFAAPRFPHLKLRIIQADYVYSHHNFFPIVPRTNMESAEISTGLVYAGGPIYTGPPPSVACAVQPSDVFPGEPINVTVTPANFNPKRTVNYSYQATGGKVSGTGATTTVDTNGANPGSYTVTATATDGRMKVPATCNASFNVKEWPAPTVSCSANPTDIDPGQTSQITATGQSAKGDLKYSYTATAGTVEGNGPNATFNSQGTQPGSATVTCTVTDDRGKTATAQTTVNVRAPKAPEPPPVEHFTSQAFDFKTHPHYPYYTYVDNDMKGALDAVAQRLASDPNQQVIVVGDQDPSEKDTQARSIQRAANVRDYLLGRNQEGGVQGQKVRPDQVTLRTRNSGGMKAEVFSASKAADATKTPELQGTTPVSEDQVTAVAKKPVQRIGKGHSAPRHGKRKAKQS